MLSFNDPALVLVLLMLSFNDPALVLVLSMLSFNDPALVLVLLMLSFIALRVCSLFERRRICTCFVLFGYICIAVGDTIIKKSMIGVLLTNLIMPQLVCCHKSLFPSTIVVVILLLTMINYVFKKCLKISKR
jgi:hypothetical protein